MGATLNKHQFTKVLVERDHQTAFLVRQTQYRLI